MAGTPSKSRDSEARQRVVARECSWCGTAFTPGPRAGHQRFCRRSCRQREYEVRTAERRKEHAIGEGVARDPREPVREVVERHTVRTVREPTQQAPRRVPARGREVQEELEQLAEAVRTRQLGHWDHGRVLRGVQAILAALNATHPGGLDALKRGW